jgi:hypothetical protein
MKKVNQKNKKRGGCYWINNNPYASVTTILSVIAKPALMYWFGKEVYYAMVKDPSLGEKAALAAPYITNDKAKTRGTFIHSLVETYKRGFRVDDDMIPVDYLGYSNAFYKFIDDLDPTFKIREKTVFSKENHYAGTLDVVLELGTGDYVIDVKTGKNIYQEAFIQGSAYQQALKEEGVETAGVGVLLLMANGDYEFKTTTDTVDLFEAFMATKKLWEFINKESLQKIDYFRKVVE